MNQDPVQMRLDRIEKQLSDQGAVQNFIHGALTTLTSIKENETADLRRDVEDIRSAQRDMVRHISTLNQGVAEIRRDVYGSTNDEEGPKSIFALLARVETSISQISTQQSTALAALEARVAEGEKKLAFYDKREKMLIGYGLKFWNTFLDTFQKKALAVAIVTILLASDPNTIVYEFVNQIRQLLTGG